MAQQTEEHHLINGSWYLVEHENLEKILLAIGKSSSTASRSALNLMTVFHNFVSKASKGTLQ